MCTLLHVRAHTSKPNVSAVEVLPIFPDFINWKHPCAQVIFDNNPAMASSESRTQSQHSEKLSQAMIR